jgi:hypothetical protein
MSQTSYDGASGALDRLAEELASEGGLLSEHVQASQVRPFLGELVAGGPRAAGARAEYAILFETIREGYLLHYAEGRVLAADDPDLALLAGDFLYARGLERLAALGDLEAVAELADLVSLAAQVHARPGAAAADAGALWLASAVAVGSGATAAHGTAKAALRAASTEAAGMLWAAAVAAAPDGVSALLDGAADAIGFRAPQAGTSGLR